MAVITAPLPVPVHAPGGVEFLDLSKAAPPADAGHRLLAYTDEAERRGAVAEWIGAQLAAGNRVIYGEAADSSRPSVISLVDRADVDVDGALRSGRLRLLPAAALGTAEGRQLLAEEALGTGETAAITTDPANPSLDGSDPRLEQATSALCAGGRLACLCQQPVTAPAEALRRAVAAHRGRVDQGTLRCAVVDGAVVVLSGSAHPTSAPIVEAVLDVAIAARPHHLRLKLQGVDYLDPAVIEAIAIAARRLRDSGGALTLDSPSRGLYRALDLCGLARMPGVVTLPAATEPGGYQFPGGSP